MSEKHEIRGNDSSSEKLNKLKNKVTRYGNYFSEKNKKRVTGKVDEETSNWLNRLKKTVAAQSSNQGNNEIKKDVTKPVFGEEVKTPEIKENIERLSEKELKLMQFTQPKIWSEYLNPSRIAYLEKKGNLEEFDEVFEHFIKNKYTLKYETLENGTIGIRERGKAEGGMHIRVSKAGEVLEIETNEGKIIGLNNRKWDDWDEVEKNISKINKMMFNDYKMPEGEDRKFYGIFTYELPHKINKLIEMRGEMFEGEKNEYYKNFKKLLENQPKNEEERKAGKRPEFLVKKRVNKKDPNKYKGELEIRFGYKEDENQKMLSISGEKILGVTTEGYIMTPTDPENTSFKPWKAEEKYKEALIKNYEKWWGKKQSGEE